MVRVLTVDADRLAERAKVEGVTVAALVGRLLDGRPPRTEPRLPQPGQPTVDLLRCSCEKPVISKIVTNLCTACGRRRPG